MVIYYTAFDTIKLYTIFLKNNIHVCMNSQ